MLDLLDKKDHAKVRELLELCTLNRDFRCRFLANPQHEFMKIGITLPPEVTLVAIDLPQDTLPFCVKTQLTAGEFSAEEQAKFEAHISGLPSENDRLQATIMKLCALDDAFRARVLTDPKGVFDEMGIQLPARIRVMAVEVPRNTIAIPVPPYRVD